MYTAGTRISRYDHSSSSMLVPLSYICPEIQILYSMNVMMDLEMQCCHDKGSCVEALQVEVESFRGCLLARQLRVSNNASGEDYTLLVRAVGSNCGSSVGCAQIPVQGTSNVLYGMEQTEKPCTVQRSVQAFLQVGIAQMFRIRTRSCQSPETGCLRDVARW